jgi:Negative regulator of sigma F
VKIRAETSAGCDLVDVELDRGLGANRALSDEAREHIRECERCKALHRWLGEASPPAAPSPELHGKIQARLKSSLKPVKPRPSIRALAAQFFVVFLLFASPGIAMLGIAGFHEASMLQVVGITVVLSLGVALLSLSLAWQMTPGSLQRIPAKVALLSLTCGFLLGTALLFPWYAPEAFFARGWTCLRIGLLAAAPAALLFWLLVRRGAPLSINTLGGTLGGIAGLLGATILQFTCSRQDAGHLLAWHGGVLVASIGMGFLIAGVIARLIGRRS